MSLSPSAVARRELVACVFGRSSHKGRWKRMNVEFR